MDILILGSQDPKISITPSNTVYGLLSSTISITSKFICVLMPSISTVTLCNLPIGKIFCWLAIHNWIGDHCSMSLPMHSHVCFGNTFASDPKTKMTSSISYSPVCTVNHISCPMHKACFPSFQTTRGSPDPAHLVVSSCNPLNASLLRSIFIHVSKKVVCIKGSILGSGWSLLPEVEASVKLFIASLNFSFMHSNSDSGSFVGASQTHKSSLGYFLLFSPIVAHLLSIMFTLGSPSRGLDFIIWIFWVGVGYSTPFSRICAISVRKSTISWSNFS